MSISPSILIGFIILPNFLADIREIFTKDWNISFHHILCERNQRVDLLVKLGVNGAEPLVVVHVPLLYFHRYAFICFGRVFFERLGFLFRVRFFLFSLM